VGTDDDGREYMSDVVGVLRDDMPEDAMVTLALKSTQTEYICHSSGNLNRK